MDLDKHQFARTGNPRQVKRKFGFAESTFNPISAFKSLINTGPAYELSLKNKAKEKMLFGAVDTSIDINRMNAKHQAGEDAYFGFTKRHEEEYPGMPLPQKVNLSGGGWEYPKKAGKEIAEIYRDRRIKDLSDDRDKHKDELDKYKARFGKLDEENEDREPDAPTPGTK